MHDIDRTQLEYSHEAGPFQHEEFEFQEFELGMMSDEMSEHEEIQLAHELLAVNNEQELEQFLGSFIKRAVQYRRPDRKVADRPGDRRRAQGRRQEGLADGRAALGGYIGGPLGAKIGAGLANPPARRSGSSRKLSARAKNWNSQARVNSFACLQDRRQAAAAAAAGADPRAAAQAPPFRRAEICAGPRRRRHGRGRSSWAACGRTGRCPAAGYAAAAASCCSGCEASCPSARSPPGCSKKRLARS